MAAHWPSLTVATLSCLLAVLMFCPPSLRNFPEFFKRSRVASLVGQQVHRFSLVELDRPLEARRADPRIGLRGVDARVTEPRAHGLEVVVLLQDF